ncbi:S66 family peptidase [Oceanobacillus neutriphilus]|uniref:LD-carboxypeptidase n=1 Tax=Oceanobacillus neutriphilus TaxID=531815 RepID=A0ABQ2NSR9_9BACI|nr:S66 peptidase family protein [Oceanobacillus neutriphilus]GGP09953.1 LD-carboxypeptidase [Oceanobacillus neutriphilus]
MLIQPRKLSPGDKVAAVSLSWGGAGEPALHWRYEQGVKRLETIFGLEVVPMPNSLKGQAYIAEHPEARAEDLMAAFQDTEIKGIISNIGGDDSIRLLPYIDFDIIRQNPKIFMGFSDTTIAHLFCFHTGLSSFYGPAIMTDFAENVAMDDYTVKAIQSMLFQTKAVGDIPAPEKWTSEFLEWDIVNKTTARKMYPNKGYELLQGNGIAQGNLIGGCIEVLEFAKGTEIWPQQEAWQNSILFFETSEEQTDPELIKRWLRNYAAQGILHQTNGIIFAKPYGEVHYEAYKEVILSVLTENGLVDLPVLYGVSFGHTEPKTPIPYGRSAQIDCQQVSFSIIEAAVTD